jgi:hypothetical protein
MYVLPWFITCLLAYPSGSYREQSAVNPGFLALGGVNVFVRNYAICRKTTYVWGLIRCANVISTLAAPLPYAGGVRFVVVQAPSIGTDSYLHISQVVVTAGGVNVALNKPCTTSSIYEPNSPCSLAVDGNVAQRNHPGTYHSKYTNGDWVKIDLQADYAVTSVTYYNRKVQSQTSDITLSIQKNLLLGVLPNPH